LTYEDYEDAIAGVYDLLRLFI
jgi:hypothetical protein